MYRCGACGFAYLTQEEADLCTPAADIPTVYPSRARPTPETSAFNQEQA